MQLKLFGSFSKVVLYLLMSVEVDRGEAGWSV